jgi:hypothetical protein
MAYTKDQIASVFKGVIVNSKSIKLKLKISKGFIFKIIQK